MAQNLKRGMVLIGGLATKSLSASWTKRGSRGVSEMPALCGWVRCASESTHHLRRGAKAPGGSIWMASRGYVLSTECACFSPTKPQHTDRSTDRCKQRASSRRCRPPHTSTSSIVGDLEVRCTCIAHGFPSCTARSSSAYRSRGVVPDWVERRVMG